MSGAARLRAAWEAVWFRPGTAVDLAAARIVFAGHALWILLSRDFAGVSGLPAPFWADTPAPARLRFLIWPGHAGAETVVQWMAVAALVAAVLGLHARLACAVAAVTLYHLAPLETLGNSPWPKGHTLAIPALLALGLSPCDDALSLARRSTVPAAPGWQYGWPVRLLRFLVAHVYVASTWAKLVRAGPEWFSADNVQRWALFLNQQEQFVVFHGLGPWLADRPPLCQAAAISVLAVGLGLPLLAALGRARPLVLLLVLVWHGLVLVAMNVAFLNVPLLLVFVEWSRRGDPTPI